MVKLNQLKLDQAKKELAILGKSTAGVRTELLIRLRDALEEKGIGVDEYEFEFECVAVEEPPAAGAPMSNQDFLAMMQTLLASQQEMKEEQAAQRQIAEDL